MRVQVLLDPLAERQRHRTAAGQEPAQLVLKRPLCLSLAAEPAHLQPRRQMLERCDECEFHGLALLVASLGRGIAVRKRKRVQDRLDPHRLDEGLTDLAGRIARRTGVDRKHALGRRAIASRHAFAAIRWSHVRIEFRSAQPGSPRQARNSVS
jgi:hypothetical protein